jgi:hypothetical protein
VGSINFVYCTSCDASARLSTGGGRSQAVFKDRDIHTVESIYACDSCKALKTISRPASSLWGVGDNGGQQVQSECPDCGDAVRMIFSGFRSGVPGGCPACSGDLVLSDVFIPWD